MRGDGHPGEPPIDPLPPEVAPRPRRELTAAMARIDGWGPRAWREVMGAWRLAAGVLVLEDPEPGGDEDGWTSAMLVLDRHGLGGGPTDADATADWVLRQAAAALPRLGIPARTAVPSAAVRATNACWIEGGRLVLRVLLRLPLAGMCCDGKRLARSLRRLEAFARPLATTVRRPALAAHRLAVARQRALRSALPAHGLAAFLGDGARLARSRDGGPARDCRPLRAPPGLRVAIDLGPLGRVRGLGIRRGVTAIAGAPYHGKSTLLAALAAGRDDHPPGDGRELVVADTGAVALLADDGRRVKATDVTPFFARLPGCDARAFATERASGATSMAAAALQAVAAGSRLLLVDEDSAAANFLAIDAGMRRLLGGALAGTGTLLEALPALARIGVSSVLVAGASSASLARADRVLLLERFAVRDATARARRIAPRPPPARRRLDPPRRELRDDPDALLGPRHFLAVGADEPERPLVAGAALDLRRCGWELDAPLARGACAGAAWACRLAAGGMDLRELEARWHAFIAARGVRGLEPFHSQLLALPPWQLVVAALERLPRPLLRSLARPRG